MEILEQPLVLEYPGNENWEVVVQSFGFEDENKNKFFVDFTVCDKISHDKISNYDITMLEYYLSKFFNKILEEAVNEWEQNSKP